MQNFSSENQSVWKPDLQVGTNFFSDRAACKIRFGNNDFQTNQAQRTETERGEGGCDAVAAPLLVREVRVQ